MRTSARWLCGAVLAATVGWVAGCGGAKDDQGGPAKADQKQDPQPGPEPKPKDPATPPAAWEMDVDRHRIPATPVAGELGGTAFAPEVTIEGNRLTFQTFAPFRRVDVEFELDPGQTLEGRELKVRHEQPVGRSVPKVTTFQPGAKPGELDVLQYENSYALTLKLGKRAKGKVAGEIYLSLPGENKKNFLAGTFTARWVRPLTVLPEPDDAPFVQGKLAVTGPPQPKVMIGYFGWPDDPKDRKPVFGMAEKEKLVEDHPAPASSQTDGPDPQVTTLVSGDGKGVAPRYEHTRLAPGRYLIYVAVGDRNKEGRWVGGSVAGKWVDVRPDTQLALDLAIDAGATGGLEVKAPAGASGPVMLVPAEEPGKTIADDLFLVVSANFGLQTDVKDGKATFPKLAPGKYEVRFAGQSRTVEVTAGKTAEAVFEPKK
ncbi:MAG TPA: hypothetical protein VKE74_32195 [Gemmataceae bacterium]|nr:hypothetical protein [Gemmataceae bacterium]